MIKSFTLNINCRSPIQSGDQNQIFLLHINLQCKIKRTKRLKCTVMLFLKKEGEKKVPGKSSQKFHFQRTLRTPFLFHHITAHHQQSFTEEDQHKTIS